MKNRSHFDFSEDAERWLLRRPSRRASSMPRHTRSHRGPFIVESSRWPLIRSWQRPSADAASAMAFFLHTLYGREDSRWQQY